MFSVISQTFSSPVVGRTPDAPRETTDISVVRRVTECRSTHLGRDFSHESHVPGMATVVLNQAVGQPDQRCPSFRPGRRQLESAGGGGGGGEKKKKKDRAPA